jgi:hypothetical protein
MKALFILSSTLFMLLSSTIVNAESLTYTSTYRAWTYNNNYPNGACFVSSFDRAYCRSQLPEVREYKGEKCDYANSALVSHKKTHCGKGKLQASIIYNFDGNKLVSIDGYFGKFNITPYTDERSGKFEGVRKDNPLQNRIYLLRFDEKDASKTAIKKNKGLSFYIFERVSDCDHPYTKDQGCSPIAEYQISEN